MSRRFDRVVVGAGGMGSAAAYHLAQDGASVLLLEQFKVGHNRGSSHGESRIIRHSYAEADYASLAPPAFALWNRLQQESGAYLLQMTGGLDAGPADHPMLLQREKTLSELDIPFEVLEGDAMRKALPQFRLPNGWAALMQDGAGILNASLCVKTMAAQAVAHGAELREEATVLDVQPDGDGVSVRFSQNGVEETVYADKAIITAGPWASHFVNALPFKVPLTVTHQQVVYYPVEQPELYQIGTCPLYIIFGPPGFYGFPIWERPGELKIATEGHNPIDPNLFPREADPQMLAESNEAIATFLVGVKPEPTSVVTCLYTETPDRDFIIDHHPEYPQILIAGGFSGHGFKFTIVVGRLLADLAAGEPKSYQSPLWRERFRITRFAD